MKRNILFLLFGLFIVITSCKNDISSTSEKHFERILQDTTNNDRAKWDLEQLAHYNSICQAIGLNKLEDGSDSLEVRVWRQFSVFGMSADEEIYNIKVIDSTYILTFYRVYCTANNDQNYNSWNSFAFAKIDSFKAISKTFKSKDLPNTYLNKIWNLKAQSELKINDSIGFLDGTTTSIEIANKNKYKLIRHHVAHSYYRVTKLEEIKKYIDEKEKIIIMFQKNKIYDF